LISFTILLISFLLFDFWFFKIFWAKKITILRFAQSIAYCKEWILRPRIFATAIRPEGRWKCGAVRRGFSRRVCLSTLCGMPQRAVTHPSQLMAAGTDSAPMRTLAHIVWFLGAKPSDTCSKYFWWSRNSRFGRNIQFLRCVSNTRE
jgi:hypothetical protein